MRRTVAVLAALTIVVGLAGVLPAGATHNCTSTSCNPVTVAILEGIGKVCTEAQHPGYANPRCTYSRDAFWTGATNSPPIAQGFYWPAVGPPARGPFSFNAGPALGPPASLCVSSINGPGCTFRSYGDLTEGSSGFGAYCGSSKGVGVSTFTSGSGPNPAVTTTATFGWEQSAATILPLQGRVTHSSPAGGVGATVVGFTSSRGTDGGGNCGVTQVTLRFNVEGMIVTF